MKLFVKPLAMVAAVLFLGALMLPNGYCQDPLAAEELGIELVTSEAAPFEPVRGAGNGGVLLIPESTNDTVGMYDPFDGTYLGDLISGFAGFSTPINAIMGPDGNIYVSDQVADSVFVFDKDGNYLSTFADASDGLNNLRGISFFDDLLYVCSGDDYVAVFDGPHSRLPDFINDGSDPFDLFFLQDGTSLMADIAGSHDNIRRYDAAGNLLGELFAVEFPEQVQFDYLQRGLLLHNSFSADQINDFDMFGTIFNTCSFPGGRGIYRLGNGNFLATKGDGVWEVDPATSQLIAQKNNGSARFIEFVSFNTAALSADVSTLPASGGQVNFTLDAGRANAGRIYLLLGTNSGTVPGIPAFGGNVVPLNKDEVFMTILTFRNGPRFQKFRWLLDADGKGSALLDTLGPVPATVAIGSKLHFAFTTTFPFDFQSNAVEIEIVP